MHTASSLSHCLPDHHGHRISDYTDCLLTLQDLQPSQSGAFKLLVLWKRLLKIRLPTSEVVLVISISKSATLFIYYFPHQNFKPYELFYLKYVFYRLSYYNNCYPKGILNDIIIMVVLGLDSWTTNGYLQLEHNANLH